MNHWPAIEILEQHARLAATQEGELQREGHLQRARDLAGRMAHVRQSIEWLHEAQKIVEREKAS